MGKSAVANTTETTAHSTGHMTYTQAPVVYEKNIFHLFYFTQPVKTCLFFRMKRQRLYYQRTSRLVISLGKELFQRYLYLYFLYSI